MSVQSLLQGEPVLPSLPSTRGERPRLPRPVRDDGAEADPASAARSASRRALLTALSGGALSPLARPEPARHRDPVLTLVNRITQGFSQEEYERAKALGFEAYLEEQLDPLSIDDSEMDSQLGQWPTIRYTPKELYDRFQDDITQPYFDFKSAALARSANSRRQLLERMVEFWNDHFSIDHNKGGLEWALLPEHDRTVIRANALGTFPVLLEACAFSGAMLFYLDNWLNVRGAPQANYARELLELHSLGVHGGYNETDVTEVARCFTGWTVVSERRSHDWMRGTFEPALHSPGRKLVLGRVIPDSPTAARPGQPPPPAGMEEARTVLRIAAAHPSTADFLARKLIHWLLTETPPQSLVDQVAATYRDTDGDIQAMLRVILTRENMSWASPLVGPRFRRPFHYMTSLFRTFGGKVTFTELALSHLAEMGHMPFDHVQPNGYPDVVEAWGQSLLPRWRFASVLLRPNFGPFAGVSFPPVAVLKDKLAYHDASDMPGLARRMNERLFGSALNAFEEDTLQQFIDGTPGEIDNRALFDWLALGAALPGSQWY